MVRGRSEFRDDLVGKVDAIPPAKVRRRHVPSPVERRGYPEALATIGDGLAVAPDALGDDSIGNGPEEII